MKRPRSQWLWLACLWFAILGVGAVWRGVVLWGERGLLFELGSSLTPLALALFVTVFVGLGAGIVAAAVGLWFWRDWARHLARACVAAYLVASQTYTWCFVRSGLTWQRRWVALVGALLALTISIGALTWPRARAWLELA